MGGFSLLVNPSELGIEDDSKGWLAFRTASRSVLLLSLSKEGTDEEDSFRSAGIVVESH